MINNRTDWYNSEMILHQIRPQLVNRYLSVRKINPKTQKQILSRYYMGYTLELLKDSLKRNNVLDNPSAKIYFDLATWKNKENITPLFSFDKKRRKEEKKIFSGNIKDNIKGEWENLIKSYDFAIDIDNEDIKKSWKDAKIIKEIFDKYKLPYSVRFSGSKGFHFIIEDKWIKIKTKIINRANLFGKIVQNLAKDEFGIDKKGKIKGSIDFSIYDSRRILKIAYSLANNNGIEFVCLPLDDKQFENFKYEDMRMFDVLRNVKLFKRGLLERNHNLSEKGLILNTLKFIKEYK